LTHGGDLAKSGLYAELDFLAEIKLTQVTFSSNSAAKAGGGMAVYGGTVELVDCDFSGNKTTQTAGLGGGVYCEDGEIKGHAEISDNQADSGGGAYLLRCNLALDPVDIQDNRALSEFGGGVALIDAGEASFKNGIIFTNTTEYSGGGLYLSGSYATFDEVFLNGNSAVGEDARGGGITLTNFSQITFRQGDINYGSAIKYGGGLMVQERSMATLEQVALTSNQATGEAGRGGGLFVREKSELYLENVTLDDNSAVVSGGGLYMTEGSAISMADSPTLSGNIAADDGGALVSRDSDLTLDNPTITRNDAGDQGAGLYLTDDSTATVTIGRFAENVAGGDGGAIALTKDATLTLEVGTVFEGNTAASRGGVYVSSTELIASDAIFLGNIAYSGGAIDMFGGSAELSGLTIDGNTATDSGAGLNLYQAEVNLVNSLVQNNTAEGSPGGGGLLIVQSDLSVSVVSFDGNSQSDTTVLNGSTGKYVPQEWGANATFSCDSRTGVCE
jgi:predicted outer membrane repeat protein